MSVNMVFGSGRGNGRDDSKDFSNDHRNACSRYDGKQERCEEQYYDTEYPCQWDSSRRDCDPS